MATSYVETHAATSGVASATWTLLNEITVDRRVTVDALSLSGTSGSGNIEPRIYSAAGSLLASGPAVSAATGFTRAPLTTPLILLPGVVYHVGFYIPANTLTCGRDAVVTVDHTHSGTDGLIYTYKGSGDNSASSGGDGFVASITTTREWTMRVHYSRDAQSGRGHNADIRGRRRRGLYIP